MPNITGAVVCVVLAVSSLARAAAPLNMQSREAATAEDGGTLRPNILFCLADDWGWPHAGVYGDPAVKTPAFDRIAREGVLFRNAYVSAPVCTPSRGSILTGMDMWQLGSGANLGGVFEKHLSTYPWLLAKAGYSAGFNSKGWGPGAWDASGWTVDPAGNRFTRFPERFLGLDAAHLREARPKGQPFCLWIGSNEPHRPYLVDGTTATVKDGIPEVKRKAWADRLRECPELRRTAIDAQHVKVPPYLPDVEAVRKDICDYYWEVQLFDSDVGDYLECLERAGELENTLVVVAGDNGWPFPRAKDTLFDAGTHVPLAIMWKGTIPGGRAVDDFVNLKDLAPTFLEAAGLARHAQMTGKSLMPLLLSGKSGQVEPQRDHVLTGYERLLPPKKSDPGVRYPSRAITTREFAYIRNFEPDLLPMGPAPGYLGCNGSPSKEFILAHREDPQYSRFAELCFGNRQAEELFDLQKDPWQFNNLANDPRYTEIKSQLGERLMLELNATRDPRVLGEGRAVFDQAPFKMQNSK